MARVVHFEIPADDPQRAQDFYRDAFGWQFDKWQGPFDYWMAITGPEGSLGINGAITRREGFVNSVIDIIGVESIEETVAKIKAAGGTIIDGPNEVPGVGIIAYFTDTEGNTFGTIQPSMDMPIS